MMTFCTRLMHTLFVCIFTRLQRNKVPHQIENDENRVCALLITMVVTPISHFLLVARSFAYYYYYYYQHENKTVDNCTNHANKSMGFSLNKWNR